MPLTPEALWYQADAPAALRMARTALLPLSWAYGVGVAAHRSVYRWGWRSPLKMPARTVAVGNVVAGGAGKTPVTLWLAQQATAAGRTVAVLARGYAADVPAGGVWVGRGQGADVAAEVGGDEPVLMARRAPGVHVFAGRNRAALGAWAVADAGADLLLLDDGMQHHRVKPEVLVAVVRAPGPVGNGRLLPAGPLRESAAGLARADAVVVLGDASTQDLAQLADAGVDPARCVRARLVPSHLWSVGGGDPIALSRLKGTPVVASAGMARPAGLGVTLAGLGARVLDLWARPDHARWDREHAHAVLARARSHGADLVVLTEKDAVKWPAEVPPTLPVLALAMDLEVSEPARLLKTVLGPP